jgi:hypothetical protein
VTVVAALVTGALLALMVLSDLPWLVAAAAWRWVEMGTAWPLPGMLVAAAVGAVLVEGGLYGLRRAASSPAATGRRLALEGAALLASGLAAGPWAGLLFWQTTVGFDAAARVQGTVAYIVRRAVLRLARLVAGLVLLGLG